MYPIAGNVTLRIKMFHSYIKENGNTFPRVEDSIMIPSHHTYIGMTFSIPGKTGKSKKFLSFVHTKNNVKYFSTNKH